ncbi:cyclic dof factor 3-like [Vicia villosa]|uniref:cyclic dof factor 3-like n=1 Tax=Vicia villosa TaxID=3911 RepID=UPI00273BF2A9|nr:cyclic dof factor 3-like [Vicia villosa]
MSEMINLSTIKLFGTTIFLTHKAHVLTNDSSQQNSTKLDDQIDMSEDKSPKKPDMTVPCPRCNSKDTKFRYYNNFKAKQPRHFCKNCQRYWTSGGTVRKMLVEAGRRKNKFTNFPLDVLHYSQMSNVLPFGSNSSDISSTSWNHAVCYAMSLGKHSVPTQSCGPSKPALRKHSRDGDKIIYSNSEKANLGLKRNNKERHDTNDELVPKLLRVDDPNDVVMSSIWSTIGIENGRGIFKGFGSDFHDKNHVVEESSSVFKVNPAALPMSIVFHVII